MTGADLAAAGPGWWIDALVIVMLALAFVPAGLVLYEGGRAIGRVLQRRSDR